MEKNIYDNSNLAESYAGATTPLTFSFAKRVYQQVYQYLGAMFGISSKTINNNKHLFSNMLEFIGYHMYYNLNNWYKTLEFLPGYQYNKVFFEKMLSPEKPYKDKENSNFSIYKILSYPKIFYQLLKMTSSFVLMNREIKRFNNYFDYNFKEISRIDIKKFNLKELKDFYWNLEERFICQWRVPVANDFAVMISMGLAEKIIKKWTDTDDVYRYFKMDSHILLSSLDPGLEIIKIVGSINKDDRLKELFKNNSNLEKILKEINENFNNTEAGLLIKSYFDNFGYRSPNELKLESTTINEEPTILIGIIRALVLTGAKEETSKKENKNHIDFKISFLKKIIINRMIFWVKNSINRREQTRFRRALIFGYVRNVFLEIGHQFENKEIIFNKRDIFYLTIDEIFEFIEKEETRDFKRTIKERIEAYGFWEKINMPRRIETSTKIEELEKDLKLCQNKTVEKASILKGLVASSGDKETLDGEVLVLEEFDHTADFSGKILVTRQTDPGWTIVFPVLKGLIVERGGMLSHAAIVARELNIPCVVGVKQATEGIKDGSMVNINLKTGEINV
jgi:rifampicin phosphotransferase